MIYYGQAIIRNKYFNLSYYNPYRYGHNLIKLRLF